MKKSFAMLLPFIGVFSVLVVQVVAIRTVQTATVDSTATVALITAPVIEDRVVDSSVVYATPEELGKVRAEYRYVSKGGLDKAKVRGQKVLDELDAYLLRLDKQVEAKKRQVAAKETELGSLKKSPTPTSPKIAPRRSQPKPSEEPEEDNY